ncbi:energy transducer TonB [Pusillimonas noertemannii]|uniref:Protein TonB n=1 Tax=Pusillimonas noertemannii TaxID=305977 RepID=A0A2U1CQJ2_9BURK|nr:TonB family protein [Pusillimonas noertemannii]PVY68157.1 protein TonB [Pusillimonas noertemannii]
MKTATGPLLIWMLISRPHARGGYLPLALVLSICVHAALLALRLHGPPPATARSDSLLEVTLVNARTETAPARPQVLAQQQINAGGDGGQKIASSPLPRTAADSPDQIVLEALRKRQAQLESEQERLYAQLQASQAVPEARRRPDLLQQSDEPGEDALLRESLVLNARISAIKEQIEHYNAQPRQRFVGPAAQEADYAQYVEVWRQRIELLGTEHYPAEARGRVYGKLQLTVYIKSNGDLLRIEIDQPSEHAVLNLAAQRIVQLAAPFAPLPDAIARRTDVLAITRTWHFTHNRLSTESP